MSVKDNEAIYDEQISPLMAQIIAICKEHHIPMAATFEYAPEDYCSTILYLPEWGASPHIKRVAATIQAGTPSPFQITTTKADGSKIIEVVFP